MTRRSSFAGGIRTGRGASRLGTLQSSAIQGIRGSPACGRTPGSPACRPLSRRSRRRVPGLAHLGAVGRTTVSGPIGSTHRPPDGTLLSAPFITPLRPPPGCARRRTRHGWSRYKSVMFATRGPVMVGPSLLLTDSNDYLDAPQREAQCRRCGRPRDGDEPRGARPAAPAGSAGRPVPGAGGAAGRPPHAPRPT
jgi:hypothetical protein